MDRAQELLVVLRRVIHAVDRHSRGLLARYGLTGPQVVVLQAVGRGEVSAGSVARAVSLSQPTVTGILDRLEARGFVERRRGVDDRRQVLVRLTPKAHRALRAAPPPLQEAFVQRFAGLADWEQTQIVSALQRVYAMMDATEREVASLYAPASTT